MDPVVALLAKNFIERRDVKAVQQSSGIYTPERTPWTTSDLEDHISGKRTLGHYLVTPGDFTRVIAFDIDLVDEPVEREGGEPYTPRAAWKMNRDARPELTRHMQLLAVGLAMRLQRHTGGMKVAIAYSGNKGLHVYGLPCESIPAELSVEFSAAVMRSFAWENSRGSHFWRDSSWPTLEVETFPKQGSLDGKDLGNLMRLPLGINRKSKEKGMFLKVVPSPTVFHEWAPDLALDGTDVPWAEVR